MQEVSKRLEWEYLEGGVRGHVWVRFLTGTDAKGAPRVYSQPQGESPETRVFSFASAPGTTVHFVPDWYTPQRAADPKAKGKDVVFAGITPQPGTSLRTENEFGLLVRPTVNPGGTYHFSNLAFTNLLSGLQFDGGMAYKNPSGKPIQEGTIVGDKAPFSSPIFENLRFSRIGTEFTGGTFANAAQAPIASLGNGALRFTNTSSAQLGRFLATPSPIPAGKRSPRGSRKGTGRRKTGCMRNVRAPTRSGVRPP